MGYASNHFKNLVPNCSPQTKLDSWWFMDHLWMYIPPNLWTLIGFVHVMFPSSKIWFRENLQDTSIFGASIPWVSCNISLTNPLNSHFAHVFPEVLGARHRNSSVRRNRVPQLVWTAASRCGQVDGSQGLSNVCPDGSWMYRATMGP